MAPLQLTLHEWGPPVEVDLRNDEREFVRTAADKIVIDHVPGTSSSYRLTAASSFVGALTYGDLTIHVLPKIGVPRLMFLMSYAIDPKRWRDDLALVAGDDTVLEAVVVSFIGHVRRALSRGLLQGYRVEEDALATVRGRVRFEQQLRQRHGIMPPIEVRFDEFTEDIEENRLLRAAVRILGRLSLRSPESAISLRRADQALQSVTPVTYDRRRVPTVVYTRLNQRYEPAVELARLIIEGSSLELRHGGEMGTGFFIDMNVVFEEFVRTALREALCLSTTAFPRAATGHALWLDTERRIRLEPDLSWWDGATCRFVGDVKYKRTQGVGAQNPDAYQLLAYLVATGLQSGMLIYAKGEDEPMVHHLERVGLDLDVVALELDTSPQAILRQIAGLAERINLKANGARDQTMAG
jgi:5-methylcytosine-specific restriction enzyme subunit McrC